MSAISDLLNSGKLPTVTVDVKINKENMIDLAGVGIIAAIIVILLNKLLLSKL